jgi:multiple sugar transport system substrate-binding protein
VGRAGYDEAFIKSYLDSEANSYNHPNAAIEPRIPGIFQYYSVAEDELSKIWAGGSDAQTGRDKIAAAWEKITDEIGRDKQIALYKASLGSEAQDVVDIRSSSTGGAHKAPPVFFL